ncbi:hypothetical protein EF912_34825, partial [Streptomyces sp. WAC07061]
MRKLASCPEVTARMTVCATEITTNTALPDPEIPEVPALPDSPGAPEGPAPAPALAVSADGAYAARLAGEGEARYPERWTLGGPEPYAVPLPLAQPEEADSEVLALADGQVLIHRRVADRHEFSLLYPSGAASGPRTGEFRLGAVDAEEGLRVRLLPPSPDGCGAFALAVGAG